MSSSSEGSLDDEQLDFFSGPFYKQNRTISHPGKPNPNPSTFAPIPKHIKWPDELWDTGTLIYNMRDVSDCIGPPADENDRTLRFDSKFESGNLMFAYQLSTDTYHLVLEYDHNRSGSCQWFYFEMKNVKKDIKYQFYISGFHKNSGVYKSGSKIFWYSVKQAEKNNISWSRGGTNYAYGITSRKTKTKRSTLQFQIKFPYDDDTVYLCYALPYTYSYLKESISNWKKNAHCKLTSSTLCTTLGGYECPLLTLESTNSPVPLSKRDCIFLTARIHPGESNGSYVIHGVIDFLTSSHPAAQIVLETNIIKIVPMVNIDGVVEGFYRAGLGGTDLNRVWMTPEPSLHPVICAIKKLITNIQKERKISIYVDFHGHSRLHGTFAYGCPNDNDNSINFNFGFADADIDNNLESMFSNNDENNDNNNNNDNDDDDNDEDDDDNFDNYVVIDKQDQNQDLNTLQQHQNPDSINNHKNSMNYSFALKNTEKIFPRMISYLTDAFSWGNCVFSFPKERKSASRIVMRKEFNIIQSFTIESSFGGIASGPRAGVLYDETIWKEIGSKCGESFFHLLTKSSLYQLCKREMYFLSPPPPPTLPPPPSLQGINEEDNNVTTSSEITQPKKESRRDMDFVASSVNRTRSSGQPTLLKLKNPSNFLTANSRIISTHSPGYAAPKWTQMQFVPR